MNSSVEKCGLFINLGLSAVNNLRVLFALIHYFMTNCKYLINSWSTTVKDNIFS